MGSQLITMRDAPDSDNQVHSPHGGEYQVDPSDGRVYDMQGNQIGKWTPADDKHSAAMADYARDYMTRAGIYAMSQVDRERALGMYRNLVADEGSVLMDIGVADVHIPTALPNFATGYKNEPPVADLVAPPLVTKKQTDDYYQFAKEDAFQRVAPIVGAPSAGVPEVSPRFTNASFSAKERALGGWVSTQVEANADAPLKIMQATMRRIMNALIIERELRVATLFATTGNWDSTLVTTLGAGFQWDGGSSSDPVADLHNRINSSWGAPSGILMSGKLWRAFQRNPQVKSYYGYKDGVGAMPGPDEMAKALKLPPIYVSEMRYINASNALDFIWGNNCYLFRQPEELPPTSQEDVATAYTFRWNASTVRDGVVNGGFVVRQFFDQARGSMGGMKLIAIHHDAEVMTSKFVGGLIVNAFQ